MLRLTSRHMEGTPMEMMLRRQNLTLALRQQMGWPPFKPANDCIAFSSGKPGDFEVGMELGRIAQMLGKDVIYSGWADAQATAPVGFSIAYRELLAVAIIERVLPYAANDQAAVVLVSTRGDEHFAIDRRGSLVRVPASPSRWPPGAGSP